MSVSVSSSQVTHTIKIMVAFLILNLDRSRSIWICQTRSIQSGEKERADLSGRSGHGHLVLICAERRRPRPLLKVNKPRRRLAAQMVKSRFFSDASEQIWIWLWTRSVSLGLT